jgi:hypothetical protein
MYIETSKFWPERVFLLKRSNHKGLYQRSHTTFGVEPIPQLIPNYMSVYRVRMTYNSCIYSGKTCLFHIAIAYSLVYLRNSVA